MKWLAPGRRVVAIVGDCMAEDKPAFRQGGATSRRTKKFQMQTLMGLPALLGRDTQ
jgi:hypothetical protein